MKNINWHSVKIYALGVIVFIIAGLQAMQGSGYGEFGTVVSFLLIVEHYLRGNSSFTK